MKKLVLQLLFLFMGIILNAQDKIIEIILEKKEDVIDYGLFNGSTFLLKLEKKNKKTYTLIDSELNIQQKQISKFYPFGDLDEEELYGEMNIKYKYVIWPKNGSETESVFDDVRNITFYNSKEFVLIGRKGDKEYYHKRDCEKSQIYIYTKNIKDANEKYFELEIPDDEKYCSYPSFAPKLLFYDDSCFLLVYGNSQIVRYNYNGRIISKGTVQNEYNDNYGPGALNHYSSSLASYQPHTINSFYDERYRSNDHTSVVNNQYSVSSDRFGEIIYDNVRDELYLYSGLYNKETKESGISITKYNNTYEKIWSNNFYESSLKLKPLLSDYKISKFFINKETIHINLLSTFNNKFNKLYVLDSNTGESKYSKEFKSPSFVRRAYHGFRAPFIVKEYFGENIGVNILVINLYESFPEIKGYIDSLNKKEEMMLFGYYVNNGVVIIKIPKKSNILKFNKFKT